MHLNLLSLQKVACIICLLLPFSIFAQDYRPGYIIKNNRDSVSGFIEYATEKKNSQYCMFRATRKGKAQKLTPEGLSAYGYYSDKRYLSISIPGSEKPGKVFVKVLTNGPLYLYQFQKQFLVKKDSLILLPTPKSKVMETDDGMRSKEDSRYKGLLNFLIADCKLSADNTRYTEVDLTNLINNYNRCKGVEPLFNKPKPAFKANYIAFGGYNQSDLLVHIDDPIQFGKSNTVFGGFGVDLSAPRLYDRIFFTLDLSYVKNFYQAYVQSKLTSDVIHEDITMDFTSIKMPLGFRYNFLKDANTPYVKAGFMISFVVSNDIRVNREQQTTYGRVLTTIKTENVFDLQKKPKGIWFAVGYNRTVFKSVQIFGELRYDSGEGYIGTPIQSFSDMKTYSFLLGVRF